MRAIFAVCLIMLVMGAACAQQAQSGNVTLNLSDTDITQALTTLSQQGNISILGDASVKGKVSCSLSGVTAEQALDTICKMNKMEWYKTYSAASDSTTDKPNATKLFKLLDALKDLGGAAVICSDPKTQTQTVFIPNAGTSVDTPALANGLKLKAVYLVRAIPDPAAKTAAKSTDVAKNVPLGDTKALANSFYTALQQMPMDQQFQTMSDLRHQIFDNMTPQQRDDMQNYFRQQHQNGQGGGWGGRGGGQNNGQGGQNTGQGGGGHHHSNSGGGG